MKMPSLCSIERCLMLAAVDLQDASDSPRLDAEVLLSTLLKRSRAYLYAYSEELVPEEMGTLFFQQVKRRKNGEPVAHLTGCREFWSLSLAVNNSTLIPRPETELLVEVALRVCDKENVRVLDLGTGTGAIALALAKEKPEWKIDAVDVQPGAVSLAKHNVGRIALQNIHVYQSCWFSEVPAGQCFDVVISNPPYIAATDKHLTEGDVRFEPHSALVADDDGYADLFLIARAARSHLCNNGFLLLEHGYTQGGKLREYLQHCGYCAVQTVCDYGGNERVTWAVWNGEAVHG